MDTFTEGLVLTLDDVLNDLRKFDALRDVNGGQDFVATRELPSTPPTFGTEDFISELPRPVGAALKQLGISKLYTHQEQAVRLLGAGKDVVLAAPTASGKTLCFALPFVLSLLKNPFQHALMLHPMKALSNDQRRQFQALVGAVMAAGGPRIDSWVFDGDTTKEHREFVKQKPPHLLLTNPEMLHQSFLGWGKHWESFLKKLNWLFLDEIHEYRGYFGGNIALLLRRFLAYLDDLNVRPRLVLASATCRNAVEHAERLTGRRCELIDAQDVMCPPRKFIFVSPAIPEGKFYEIYRLRVVLASLALLSRGLSILVFCQSRKFAEDAYRLAASEAVRRGLDSSRIMPYRSGYKSDNRREVEEGLREGRYRVVFTTSALELGIDVGKLDACLLAGFPDSVMSAWQRIGRAGRSWDKTAWVLYYAMNNPFDQFFVQNIDAFLERELDELFVNPENEELIEKHLPYLLHEIGDSLDDDKLAIIGDRFFARAKEVSRETRAHRGSGPNYQRLAIRASSGGVKRIVCNNEEIGTISETQAFREAYLGASYSHAGKTYEVVAHRADEIEVKPCEPRRRTVPRIYPNVFVKETLDGLQYGTGLSIEYGKVAVIETYCGYSVVDESDPENVSEEKEGNASLAKEVFAAWLRCDRNVLEEADPDAVGIRSIEQLFRIGANFVIPCDRHDVGTWVTAQEPATVFLYETVKGGIGVAEKMLERWKEVLQKGVAIAERCRCDTGCPRCIHPPRYRRSSGGVLDKRAAIRLATHVLERGGEPPTSRFDPKISRWREIPSDGHGHAVQA
ncbi:MAG: DEAD/DEAH box helicase [Tepidisphaerales bacterium]